MRFRLFTGSAKPLDLKSNSFADPILDIKGGALRALRKSYSGKVTLIFLSFFLFQLNKFIKWAKK